MNQLTTPMNPEKITEQIAKGAQSDALTNDGLLPNHPEIPDS